jgi:DNA-binding ferritin-like protein
MIYAIFFYCLLLLLMQNQEVWVLKQQYIFFQATEDEATVDLLMQRLAVHEKNIWMLKVNNS